MDKKLVRHFEAKIKREGQRYQNAKALWLSGKSLSKIEREVNFPRHTLSSLLKYEGYEVKTCGQKYAYNADFFKVIDTEEKAYWLGFLYADGEVTCFEHYSLRVGLAIKDYGHIVRLKNLICPELPIKTYEALETTYMRYHMAARICFCSKELVLGLLDKGCYPNKEQILAMPYEHLPKHLIRHFVRGFFDGDGSAAFSNPRQATIRFLSASEQIIVDIQNELVKYGVKRNSIIARKRKGATMPLYTFTNSAKADLKKIYDYFYKDATIYLDRKKKILDDILNYDTNSRLETSSQKSQDDESGIKLEGPLA